MTDPRWVTVKVRVGGADDESPPRVSLDRQFAATHEFEKDVKARLDELIDSFGPGRRSVVVDIISDALQRYREGVYVIRLNGDLRVKVGRTSDLRQRLATFRTTNPDAEVVAYFPLERTDGMTLSSFESVVLAHAAASTHRIGGEVFEFSSQDALDTFVAEIEARLHN